MRGLCLQTRLLTTKLSLQLCAQTPASPRASSLSALSRSFRSCPRVQAPPREAYVCSDCGHDSPKWAGRCPGCGSWNTMKAVKLGGAADSVQSRNVRPATFAVGAAAAATAAAGKRPPAASSVTGAASASTSSPAGWLGAAAPAQATAHFTRLKDIRGGVAPRQATGSGELDRLFNGGLAAGSLTLACGSPGVGKSTLLLQLAALLSGFTDAAGQPYAASFCGKGGGKGRRGAAAAGGRGSPSIGGAGTGAASTSAFGGVAYVSGEESAEQIRERARRLGIGEMDLWLLNETCVDTILEKLQDILVQAAAEAEASGAGAGAGVPPPSPAAVAADAAGAAAAQPQPPLQHQPALTTNSQPLRCVIIDSIQTMWTAAFPTNQAGTVTQVRESAVRLLQFAKATGVPVILVGHVTKAGDIAGPRVLEHIVDTVVFMENDESAASTAAAMGGGGGGGHHSGSSSPAPAGMGAASTSSSGYRILRALKNRFGSTSEIALLEMTHRGFVEADAARLFVSNDAVAAEAASGGDEAALMRGGSRSRSGSAVTAALEGTRALTVELQALVFPSFFAHPRQRAMGFSSDRLTMVLALLGRYPRIKPRFADVLANVVGGLRLSDTGSDLALAVALASCFLGAPPPRRTLFVGELGLGGEVRPVPGLQARLAAARKLGFARAIVPAGSGAASGSSSSGSSSGSASKASGKSGAGTADAGAGAGAAAPGDTSDASATFVTTPVSTLTQALVAAFGQAVLFGSGPGAGAGAGGGYRAGGGGYGGGRGGAYAGGRSHYDGGGGGGGGGDGGFAASVTGGVVPAAGPSPNRYIAPGPGPGPAAAPSSASSAPAPAAPAAAPAPVPDSAGDPLLPPFDLRAERFDAFAGFDAEPQDNSRL